MTLAYVQVPKDLTRVKTKVMFNLTQRQLVCFTLAAAAGIPFYLLTKNSMGSTLSACLMIVVMLPFFFFAMYEKDGLPAEKLLFNRLRFMLWPKERPYKTNNLYQYLSKKEVSAIAKNQTAGGAGKKIAAKHHAVKTAPRRR